MRENGQQPPKDESGSSDEEASSDDSGDSDNSADSDQPFSMSDIPGMDNGSPMAQKNYHDYILTRNTYEIYMMKFFKDYNAKIMPIVDAYTKMMQSEQQDHDNRLKAIDEEEQRAMENAHGDPIDHTPFDLKRRKENLRHKKEVNSLGNSAYHQWSGVYFPQYTQKMRPMLHNYWNVCALYVRNMEDPEVMKREYARIVNTYWMYAMQATGDIGGGKFQYLGETDEEEAQLEADIKAAEEEAEAKKHQFENDTKSADNVLPKWLEDKLQFSIGVEFLALTINPHGIEFEAYVPGVNGKVTYDFESQSFKTSTSLCAKIDVGMKIGPLDMKFVSDSKNGLPAWTA
jgi:hypothetical protein